MFLKSLKKMLKIYLAFSIVLMFMCAREPVTHPEIDLPDAATPPPEGFIEIIDIIPSIKLELRYFSTNNFIGEILKGYEAERAYLLPETAAKIAKVQEELLTTGLSLKIWDSYRPLRAEYQMLDWARENNRQDLLEGGYLNTNINKYFIYGHPNGNCVDLTIIDADGNELDMGTDFDHFTKEAWTMNAEGTVLENRLLLKNLMEKNGFRHFAREWWHFTDRTTPEPLHDEVIIK